MPKHISLGNWLCNCNFKLCEKINFETIVYVRWVQEGFTVEPPRNDSEVKFQCFGPKVRVTGQKSELQTKSQSYSWGDRQSPNQIAQKRNPNGVEVQKSPS